MLLVLFALWRGWNFFSVLSSLMHLNFCYFLVFAVLDFWVNHCWFQVKSTQAGVTWFIRFVHNLNNPGLEEWIKCNKT